ncbi:MAG: hypothetical protein QOE70_6729 [Chthoniobacter sp.]|jgi:hypothetical protein|nr:hypothetical protein [Chthoniobacter sp.]
MKTAWLTLLLGGAMGLALRAEPVTEPAPEDARDKARREAWGLATHIVSLLEQGDNAPFPGLRAWLEDFHRTAATVPTAETVGPFPAVDSDALVTHNPHFWDAYFEIQPADPGLALLHSSLLLTGGEAQRAIALALFGLQRGGLPDELRRSLGTVIAQAQAAQARSFELVREGVRLHDARNFTGALKKYEAALVEWPANGWGHYERGFTLRMKAIADAGKPASKTGNPAAPEPAGDPPETQQAFAEARRHDPFQIMAYQGDDPGVLAGLMALVRAGLPVWESIRKHPDEPAKRENLHSLATACREAAIDDFALVLRQLQVSRNKNYSTEDHAFIAECLRRLAPAAAVSTLARLTAEPRLPMRQIALPPATEPPELASASPARHPPAATDPPAKSKTKAAKVKEPAPKARPPKKPQPPAATESKGKKRQKS